MLVVNVPVLSEQMTEVQPRVSTDGKDLQKGHYSISFFNSSLTNRFVNYTFIFYHYIFQYLRKGFTFKDNTLYSPLKKEVLQGEVEILRQLNGEVRP